MNVTGYRWIGREQRILHCFCLHHDRGGITKIDPEDQARNVMLHCAQVAGGEFITTACQKRCLDE